MVGTIYLIHFDAPLGDVDRPHMHASHYLGWTEDDDVDGRIARHRAGDGAKILAAANLQGITYAVVRTWADATRDDERRMKKSGHFADRLCPVCKSGEPLEPSNTEQGSMQ